MKKIKDIKLEQIVQAFITIAIIGMAIFNIIDIISDNHSYMQFFIAVICIMAICAIIIDIAFYKMCLNEIENN